MGKTPLTERQVLNISVILQALIIMVAGAGALWIADTTRNNSEKIIRNQGQMVNLQTEINGKIAKIELQMSGFEKALRDATNDRFRGKDADNMQTVIGMEIKTLIEEDDRQNKRLLKLENLRYGD